MIGKTDDFYAMIDEPFDDIIKRKLRIAERGVHVQVIKMELFSQCIDPLKFLFDYRLLPWQIR